MDSSQEKARNAILERLLSRVYSPGERLIESKLASELEMSRTPVRFALSELVQSGLLDRTEPGGCIVPYISPGDMFSVFETRASLEGQAAYWAAQRASAEDTSFLNSLQMAEEKIYSSADFPKKYTDLNSQFHSSVAKASGNPYLIRYIDQIYWRSQIYVFFFDRFYSGARTGSNPHDKETSITFGEHREIIEAIAGRDGELAKKCMEKHVLSTYGQYVRS
jgi:DNA-binding GntR family transcriptional regulator